MAADKVPSIVVISDWYQQPKILELIADLGWDAAGLTNALFLKMRASSSLRLNLKETRGLSLFFQTTKERLEEVINYCLGKGIFEREGDEFYSKEVCERVQRFRDGGKGKGQTEGSGASPNYPEGSSTSLSQPEQAQVQVQDQLQDQSKKRGDARGDFPPEPTDPPGEPQNPFELDPIIRESVLLEYQRYGLESADVDAALARAPAYFEHKKIPRPTPKQVHGFVIWKRTMSELLELKKTRDRDGPKAPWSASDNNKRNQKHLEDFFREEARGNANGHPGLNAPRDHLEGSRGGQADKGSLVPRTPRNRGP